MKNYILKFMNTCIYVTCTWAKYLWVKLNKFTLPQIKKQQTMLQGLTHCPENSPLNILT